MSAVIQLKHLGLDFGEHSIFKNVNLDISKNEFISIIGKSGIGKTTLLRMVAGLLEPTHGGVYIEGEHVTEPREDTTYVFQKPILLEWRTLIENVLLPIVVKGKVKEEDVKKAKQLLQFVELEEHQHKYPHECSGGMLSRAALARSLITNPKILLMDEPFAALDSMTKEQLQLELTQMFSTYQSTVMFITHDIHEAVFLSDRVLLLGDQNETKNEWQEFDVPFPRPRQKELKFEPEFLQLVKRVYEGLEKTRGSAS